MAAGEVTFAVVCGSGAGLWDGAVFVIGIARAFYVTVCVGAGKVPEYPVGKPCVGVLRYHEPVLVEEFVGRVVHLGRKEFLLCP